MLLLLLWEAILVVLVVHSWSVGRAVGHSVYLLLHCSLAMAIVQCLHHCNNVGHLGANCVRLMGSTIQLGCGLNRRAFFFVNRPSFRRLLAAVKRRPALTGCRFIWCPVCLLGSINTLPTRHRLSEFGIIRALWAFSQERFGQPRPQWDTFRLHPLLDR